MQRNAGLAAAAESKEQEALRAPSCGSKDLLAQLRLRTSGARGGHMGGHILLAQLCLTAWPQTKIKAKSIHAFMQVKPSASSKILKRSNSVIVLHWMAGLLCGRLAV